MEPTNISDIRLPQELVTLKHLRTNGGQPVQVMCEALDDLTMAELTGGLSGARGTPPSATGDPVADAGGVEALARLTDDRAVALIGRATWIGGPDGSEVRPAFWFDPNAPRDARSIPGRMLRYEDRIALLEGIMRAGNYLGGQADATSFPIHGEGLAGGVGVGAAGGPDGDAGPCVVVEAEGTVADGVRATYTGEGVEP